MKRRDFLHASLAATAATATRPPLLHAEEEVRMPPRVLDTHTHFYDLEKPGGIPWPGPKSDLYRTVMLPEFKSLTAPFHVHATVVIEAVWPVEDNQWALDVLAPDAFVPGIIGKLPINDDFQKHAERFDAHPTFKGIRVRAEEFADPAQHAHYKWMAKHNWTIDVLGRGDFLPDLLALARAVPDLHIVIDHLPFKIPKGKEDHVAKHLAELAKRPNVFAKVSNVLRKEHGSGVDEVDNYRPVLDHIWKLFGPDRVIYGSNWPVSNRVGPYHAVFGVMRDYMADKSEKESAAYFWDNAVRAYRL